MIIGLKQWWRWAGMAVVMTGCATEPVPISDSPLSNSPLAQVHANPSDHRGYTVRWGGTALEVENRGKETVLLILGRPLDDEGKPLVEGASPGRFIANVKGFLDPGVYSSGRLVTVVGTIAGSESKKIDSHSYRYPVVAVDDHYLWPRQTAQGNDCNPRFWYGSRFYPWYRFGDAGPVRHCS
ncbi:MAG: Slp family lipoprotein [Nitrococcus sp.]|nr:Slp family lipoprotein [Nitrococcus sp.]